MSAFRALPLVVTDCTGLRSSASSLSIASTDFSSIRLMWELRVTVPQYLADGLQFLKSIFVSAYWLKPGRRCTTPRFRKILRRDSLRVSSNPICLPPRPLAQNCLQHEHSPFLAEGILPSHSHILKEDQKMKTKIMLNVFLVMLSLAF